MFSFLDLTSSRRLHTLVDGISRVPKGHKPNPLESKVEDIHEKMLTLLRIFNGQALRFIPDAHDSLGPWQSIDLGGLPGELDRVGQAWEGLRMAFLADDNDTFAVASMQLASALHSLPAAHRPPGGLIATELHYNRTQPFRKAWQLMVLGVVSGLAAAWIRRRWCTGLVVASLIGAFGVLRRLIVPLTACTMGALALLLADLLPIDPYIRPIAPVLRDTVWMAIHVPIIMVSYAVLAIAVVMAHVQLIVLAFLPKRREFAETVDALHYWYILIGTLLLGAGIVTGSMWAASSWERYWGWDPKEVWSFLKTLSLFVAPRMP